MLYRVVSNGVDVEFTNNLPNAEAAYKDVIRRSSAELFAIVEGITTLLKRHVNKVSVFGESAKYKS